MESACYSTMRWGWRMRSPLAILSALPLRWPLTSCITPAVSTPGERTETHAHRILNQLGQNKICINEYCLYLFICFSYSVIFFLNFCCISEHKEQITKNCLDSYRFLRSISHFTQCCYFFCRVQQTGKVVSVGSMKSERILANISCQCYKYLWRGPRTPTTVDATRFLNRMPLNYQYKCLFVY